MTTLHRLSTACAASALAIAVSLGAPSAASAQSQADFAEMMAAMKRLEARVAALEGENKQAKHEAAAARAEARALRQRMGTAPAASAAAAPNVAALPPGTYAMATKAPPLAPVPSWGGLYWGAAFGAGWMRGRTDTSSTDASTDTNTSSSGSMSANTVTETSSSSISGRDAGAIVNLYLGYNFLATPTVILGGQVEGGVSSIRVHMDGSGSATFIGSSFSPPGTLTGTNTTPESFSTTNTLDNRWMVSVLGRGGVLLDPADLLYVIGGYTYGRFEAFGTGIGLNRTDFGLNGATIGAGWERQLTPGWTLRGEYRYTKFQSKDVTTSSSTSETGTSRNAAGAVTSTATASDMSTTTNRVSADMQSLWLGVAHYFSP